MNRILSFIGIAVLLLLGVYLIMSYDKKHDVKLAKRYIKEYRFAKALDLLNKSNKKNAELQQLLFYAAIKAKNFNTAEVILDDIEVFDASFKTNFYEIVKVLYKKDKEALMEKVLSKASKIKLEQKYLINLSKKQKNIDKEMQVLLMGRKLFLKIKEDLLNKKKLVEAEAVEIDQLEKYILERYMNQASLFIAHQDYKSALEQMKNAEILFILQEKQLEDPDPNIPELELVEFKEEKGSYKYLLGTIYKFLGNKELAWKLIKKSAELGNIQAKDSIEQAKRRYRRN